MEVIKTLLHKNFRIYFASSSWIIFILIFKPIFDLLGTGTAAMAALPVAITGILFGLRVGIISSVVSLILATILLNISGAPGWDVILRGGGSIGAIVIFLIGIGSGFIRDQEERRSSGLRELAETEHRLGALMEYAPIVMFVIDKEGIFTLSEGRGLEKLGLKPGKVVGQSVYELYSEVPDIIENIRAALNGNYREYTAKVGELVFDTTVTPMKNSKGEVTSILGVATDITERYQAEKQLRRNAFRDEMTGLPNREMFMYRLELAIERLNRLKRNSYLVIYLDIDNLKKVNDTLGHSAGDGILIRLGNRIESQLRNKDILARIGGDEFAILVEDVIEPSDTLAMVDRILEQLNDPFKIEGREFAISCSLGVYIGRINNISAEEQLHLADLAMYKAKKKGGNGYAIFDDSLQEASRANIKMEKRLTESIQQKRMSVHYQPIINMENERIVGVEALVRFDDSRMKEYSVEDLVSLAGHIGLITKIDAWVLSTACNDLVKFQENLDNDQDFVLHVNHCVQSIMRDDLINQLKKIIKETGIEPDRIVLEITESEFIDNPMQLEERILLLNDLGVRVALDDLGTGYSSLRQLLALPISRIKIDREFVMGIDQSSSKKAVVAAIILLAEGLQMEVIGEGIESVEVALLLSKMGCNLGQGYYYHRPMSDVEIMELLIAMPSYAL